MRPSLRWIIANFAENLLNFQLRNMAEALARLRLCSWKIFACKNQDKNTYVQIWFVNIIHSSAHLIRGMIQRALQVPSFNIPSTSIRTKYWFHLDLDIYALITFVKIKYYLKKFDDYYFSHQISHGCIAWFVWPFWLNFIRRLNNESWNFCTQPIHIQRMRKKTGFYLSGFYYFQNAWNESILFRLRMNAFHIMKSRRDSYPYRRSVKTWTKNTWHCQEPWLKIDAIQRLALLEKPI